MISSKFWSRKKVFITGHSGFKGTWLIHWLNILNANTVGFSKDISKEQETFFASCSDLVGTSYHGDVCDADHLQDCLEKSKPEIVFHLAAQPFVRTSFVDPVATFATNFMGTVNLLEGLRKVPSVRAVVIVTSDKVYRNAEGGMAFCEEDRLGGDDPYSASKACAEILTDSFVKSFFSGSNCAENYVGIATARAGNVIGGGDWGENRLVPDLARALRSGEEIEIRSPEATRPWQFILDVLHGYLTLAERLYQDGEAFNGPWNFGPNLGIRHTVADVAAKFSQGVDIRYAFIKHENQMFDEKTFLSIDNAKAREKLGWQVHLPLEQSIDMTRYWYREFYDGKNPRDLCAEQISFFQKFVNFT